MPPLLCYQGLTRLLASSQIAVTFGTAASSSMDAGFKVRRASKMTRFSVPDQTRYAH